MYFLSSQYTACVWWRSSDHAQCRPTEKQHAGDLLNAFIYTAEYLSGCRIYSHRIKQIFIVRPTILPHIFPLPYYCAAI